MKVSWLCSIQLTMSDCSNCSSLCSVQGRLLEGEAGLGIQLHSPSPIKKKVYCCAEPEVTASWILIANNDCFGILSQCSEHWDCISVELLPAIFAVILHSHTYYADDKGVNHLFTVISIFSASVRFSWYDRPFIIKYDSANCHSSRFKNHKGHSNLQVANLSPCLVFFYPSLTKMNRFHT